MNIADLKERKKELKLTTQQLAYLAELPVGTVSKIMTGETKNPSYATVEKLEKALLHKEMVSRIEAYREAFHKYLQENQGDIDIDTKKFEDKYRSENNLDNAPIPFARKKKMNNSVEGNLAKSVDYRITTSILGELGEDKYVELLDGRLLIDQAPGLEHQIIVQNLGKILDKFIEGNNGRCKVFNVGVNVFLDEDEYTMLIPDVAVICDESRLDEKGIIGAPDFVIEVVSDSTRHIDYNEKMHKYMGAGVREYWIVDPEKERITVYLEGEPMMVYVYGFDDEVPVEIYDGMLTICGREIKQR